MLHFAERIIAALATANSEFTVVGGISAVLHGAPIVTQDLDVCYRRTAANLDRVAAALAPLQPRLRDMPEGVPSSFDRRSLELGMNFTLLIEEGEEFDLIAPLRPLNQGYHVTLLRLNVGRAIILTFLHV